MNYSVIDVFLQIELQMIIEFEHEYLRELYEEGKTSDRKHRYQPQVIRQYRRVVDTLRNAPNTEFLYHFNSLHYEKKLGNLAGIEAVWVNVQYRLEFRTRTEGEKPDVITVCSLIKLSAHYK